MREGKYYESGKRKQLKLKNKSVTIITSWDDGSAFDIRLAELLRRYSIPAIFYIPTRATDLKPHQIKDLAKDFEIGSHTLTHRILRDIAPEECYCELKESKELLENLIGEPVTSLCYPRGRYNENVKCIARDLGYWEARTTKVLNLFKPKDTFEIETSIHVFNRKEYNGSYWLDIALDLFNKVIDPNRLYNYFHLWGHSLEISRYNYWHDLEILFGYINESIHLNS